MTNFGNFGPNFDETWPGSVISLTVFHYPKYCQYGIPSWTPFLSRFYIRISSFEHRHRCLASFIVFVYHFSLVLPLHRPVSFTSIVLLHSFIIRRFLDASSHRYKWGSARLSVRNVFFFFKDPKIVGNDWENSKM